MALAFLGLGLVLIVVGYRGTYSELAALVANDMPGFLPWFAAVAALGAIGYAPGLEGLSNALLALVILVIVLANSGAWSNIAAAFGQAQQQPAQSIGIIPTSADKAALAAGPTINLNVPGGSSTRSSSGGSAIGSALGAVGGIAKLFGGLF